MKKPINNKSNHTFNTIYQDSLRKISSRLIIKSILILVIITVTYLALVYYNKYYLKTNNITFNNKSTDTITSNNTLKQLDTIDKFMDIVLQDLGAVTNTIPETALSDNEKARIAYYNTFFNPTTQDAIKTFVISDNLENINRDNLEKVITNYNLVKTGLNDILDNLNNQLLKQLQKNYARAHKINTERQIDLENIDYLPQRFD
jgi:hypothetical protein